MQAKHELALCFLPRIFLPESEDHLRAHILTIHDKVMIPSEGVLISPFTIRDVPIGLLGRIYRCHSLIAGGALEVCGSSVFLPVWIVHCIRISG